MRDKILRDDEDDLRRDDRSEATLIPAARRAVCQLIKRRARLYGRRPATLDALHQALSTAAPATLIAVAEHLIERESRSPRRWFGFGGEVTLVNALAARLLGRTQRRVLSRRALPGNAPRSDTH